MKKTILTPLLIVLFACQSIPIQPTPTPPSSPPAQAALALYTPTSALTPSPNPVLIPQDTPSTLERLGSQPCPDSDFTCLTLTVPLDHFNPSNPQTIKVVFGILPTKGERKGLFVTATGGPGYSGLSAADDYTSAFDESITDHFDIVFFDQRGLGASGGLQCVNAATTFYQAEWLTFTPEQEANFLQTARSFSQDCIAEMGLPVENLPFYSTRQAVEDLEYFRKAIGDEKFWLYGESYGSQFAQTYAAVYPDHLAGLILDGAVDLTLSGVDFLNGQAKAFYQVLIDTLQNCNLDENCTTDLGGDALSFYDDLASEISTTPARVNFPLPEGRIEPRQLTYSDLEFVVSSELYSEGSRLMLLRALAAAQRSDLTPLTRLLYVDEYLDPATLEPIPDPSYSDAVYYTVECNDYNYFSGSIEQRAEAWLRTGDELEKSLPYLSSIFYGDFPCVFWPAPGEKERPAPLEAKNIPTLVLGATADPATPLSNGESVFNRLTDGYLITTQGGAHVIFGRGDPCPDDLVTAFLVEGKAPDKRRTTCEGAIFDEYVPLAASDAKAYTDPLETMMAIDNEIYYLPEYYYWDYLTPKSVGCSYGGRLTFEASNTGDNLSLSKCAFVQGFALTGTGVNDTDAGIFTLNVTVSGYADGAFKYVRDDNEGANSLIGEYNGQSLDLNR